MPNVRKKSAAFCMLIEERIASRSRAMRGLLHRGRWRRLASRRDRHRRHAHRRALPPACDRHLAQWRRGPRLRPLHPPLSFTRSRRIRAAIFSPATADTPTPAASPCRSANVSQLRTELDAFARTRLTASDFDPVLEVEAELDLNEVTPGTLPNAEPAGTLRHGQSRTRIRRPQCAVTRSSKNLERQTHQAEAKGGRTGIRASRELSAIAILTTPNCHPDSAAIRRERKRRSQRFSTEN